DVRLGFRIVRGNLVGHPAGGQYRPLARVVGGQRHRGHITVHAALGDPSVDLVRDRAHISPLAHDGVTVVPYAGHPVTVGVDDIGLPVVGVRTGGGTGQELRETLCSRRRGEAAPETGLLAALCGQQ